MIGAQAAAMPVMVIYIDETAVLNMFVNSMILMITARAGGIPCKKYRLLLGAAAGTAYAIFAFFEPLWFLYSMPGKAAMAIAIALISFGIKNNRRFWRSVLLFAAISFLFGGGVYALNLLFSCDGGIAEYRNGAVLPVSFRAAMLFAAIVWAVTTLIFKRILPRAEGRHERATTVYYLDRKAEFITLEDTGSSLCDPITGKPVMVADFKAIESALPDCAQGAFRDGYDAAGIVELISGCDGAERFRVIACNTVTDSALLAVFRPDRIVIDGKETDALIAVSRSRMNDSRGCEATIGTI